MSAGSLLAESAGPWKNWDAELGAATALLLGLPRAGQEDSRTERCREGKEPLLLKVSFKRAGRGNPVSYLGAESPVSVSWCLWGFRKQVTEMKLSLENQLCMFNFNFSSGKSRNDINLGGRKGVFGLEQQVQAEGLATVGWQDKGLQYPWGVLGTRTGRDNPR